MGNLKEAYRNYKRRQKKVRCRYTKLETLLKSQDFRKADIETAIVMLAVANRQSEGWLRT
ncbi:GUN4 domain-containing protein, partial [Cylindrospermopsis raciborskii]